MKQLALLLIVLSLSLEVVAQSGIFASTGDGRRVLLKSDQTWEYIQVESDSPENSAVLSVTEVVEMGDACLFQIRMQNNLGYRISALVPRLAVYNEEGIVFDNRSLSFTAIKPTSAKYTKVQFTGIGCHEMSQVVVFDASRCKMGEIDPFNEEEGQCLSHIYVEPSDLINISK
jgi:hypothetical protein